MEPGVDLGGDDLPRQDAADSEMVLKERPTPSSTVRAEEKPTDISNMQTQRIWMGRLLMAVGVIVVMLILGWAAYHIGEWFKDPPNGEWTFYAALVKLIAHGIVSGAAAWFGYQLVKAGERMMLPLDLADDAKDLLGTSSPLKQIERIAKLLPTKGDES